MNYDPLHARFVNRGQQGKSPSGPIAADWILKGDLIRVGSGTRKVRAVTKDARTGYVRDVWCVKKHRSGYPSPITYLDRHRLRTAYSGLAARGMDLYMTELEADLQAEVEEHEQRLATDTIQPAQTWGITESDVVGVLI